MKVKFLKKGIYRGTQYPKDSIVEMANMDMKAFIDCKVVELYRREKKVKAIEEMGYKELRVLCKEKGLPAVGSKEELALSLKGLTINK
ncbi:MAG: hypothetical protein A2Z35_05925 [Actinobacteria bacterium RBG_19FT_COMBO_36_27]|nr:MAG: hypothetical protein A2Z35_05925 [Actinobacteria bacterium RBG_19FT_COMBO_36_27]